MSNDSFDWGKAFVTDINLTYDHYTLYCLIFYNNVDFHLLSMCLTSCICDCVCTQPHVILLKYCEI